MGLTRPIQNLAPQICQERGKTCQRYWAAALGDLGQSLPIGYFSGSSETCACWKTICPIVHPGLSRARQTLTWAAFHCRFNSTSPFICVFVSCVNGMPQPMVYGTGVNTETQKSHGEQPKDTYGENKQQGCHMAEGHNAALIGAGRGASNRCVGHKFTTEQKLC